MRRLIRVVRIKFRRLALMVLLFQFALLRELRNLNYEFTYATAFERDGGGAQLHSRVSTWAFAVASGATFNNTQIVKVDHGDSSEDWVGLWNDLIAFPTNRNTLLEGGFTSPPSRSVVSALLDPWRVSRRGLVSINIRNPHYFADAFPEVTQDLRPALRRVFAHLSNTEVGWTAPDVGIHLRVQQPTDTSHDDSRLSNLPRIIEALGLEVASKSVLVFVSPTGVIDQSGIPAHFKFCFDDAPTAIRKMVTVRNLVVGKSSMSYLAGLISEQVVWCQDFWHPVMANWRRL